MSTVQVVARTVTLGALIVVTHHRLSLVASSVRVVVARSSRHCYSEASRRSTGVGDRRSLLKLLDVEAKSANAGCRKLTNDRDCGIFATEENRGHEVRQTG